VVDADEIRLEILKYSQLEHLKSEKDLSLVLPVDHPRRVEIRKSADNLMKEIAELKGEKWERSDRR